MAKHDRQLERIRRADRNVRPEELRAVLERYGFSLRSVHGSHWIYRHPALARRLSVPYRRPLKPIYVRMSLEAIDEVLAYEDS
ncbi:MAG: type II toxin-antitoxin system HicA family toxin [Dehalococcoidia bacterium]